MNDTISRQEVIETSLEFFVEFLDGAFYENAQKELIARFQRLPSVEPQRKTEWNNHTVACLLAELFGDTCACNYNGIDEWLSEKCEVIDACPKPVGVACWEQFLKHRAERRTDGRSNRQNGRKK